MKNLFLFLGIAFLVSGCNQNNQETPQPTDFGYLSMNIVLSIEEEASSSRVEAVSTDDWSVTIFSAVDDSEVINFTPFIDAPAEVQLPTGEYYVEANSNNFQEAAFENPYYFGRSANFTIDKEELKTIDIDAELANSKVAINYSTNVTSTFDDYTGAVTVVSSGTTLDYVQGETREGYFVAEPLSVVVNLSYTKLDGTFIKRQFNADIDAQPKTLYNINLDATLEDGEIVININVDEGFETVEVEVGDADPKIFLDDNGVTIKAAPDAVIGDSEVINGITYTVVSEEQLRDMVQNGEDVASVCTSKVTDMSSLFSGQSDFNQDISSWDVSGVTNMFYLFFNATAFNQDIGSWDVSNVTNMFGTFLAARSFNQNIDNWNVSNVTNMFVMFSAANAFNQPIGSWDVSNVTDMGGFLQNAFAFNQDISSWNVSSVVRMGSMFRYATSFNQDISSWDVSNSTDMVRCFERASSFNQNISSWDVSNVTNMFFMFYGATAFNQDLSIWDVSNVTSCSGFQTSSWPAPTFTNCTP